MTGGDYRAALDAAVSEYEALGAERRRIDDRLAQLAQTIGTLSRLVGLTPTVPFGLTDAVRLVYRNAGVPLSPTDARERLRAIGFDLSSYSSEMSAIHTVLKRLNEAGELRFIASAGKHLYRWQVPATPVAIGPEVAAYIRGAGRFHTGLRADTPKPRRRKKIR